MLFNSLEFAVFLPVVLVLHGLAGLVGRRLQNLILLVAGYVFYGSWDTRFLFLVSVSTVLDFCTGLMIGEGRMTRSQRLAASVYIVGAAFAFLVLEPRAVRVGGAALVHVAWSQLLSRTSFGLGALCVIGAVVAVAHLVYPSLASLPEERRRLFFLRCSVIGQLGMLATFKYYDFFIDSAQLLIERMGLDASRLHLHVVLPIGISFYTLQTLSYVIDVYWRRLKPVALLTDFALYVSYFPPLFAGPIERASHLVPRLLGDRRVTREHVSRGLALILFGLFKKIAIADGLAASVASIFDGRASVGWLDVVAGSVAFAFQIYGDFSGYSDIASGCSLLFGIELLENFDLPYFSVNPSEFWRRWHISLSTWLRDYLYIPLGGNRGTVGRTYRNLLITMVLGGLWHGAAWNFLFWGAYHGLLLVVHRMLVGRGARPFEGSLMRRLPRMILFFGFVCYGWLMFRASSLAQVAHLTKVLVTGPFSLHTHMKVPPVGTLVGVPLLLFLEACEFRARAPKRPSRFAVPLEGALAAALLILVLLGASTESRQFIYFQF
jgi:alginate O-acetyltransferase complex protein AlgI